MSKIPFLSYIRAVIMYQKNSCCSLDRATGLALRFVIGRTKDSKNMTTLQKEIDIHHDFLLIDADEDNLNLPHKT